MRRDDPSSSASTAAPTSVVLRWRPIGTASAPTAMGSVVRVRAASALTAMPWIKALAGPAQMSDTPQRLSRCVQATQRSAPLVCEMRLVAPSLWGPMECPTTAEASSDEMGIGCPGESSWTREQWCRSASVVGRA